MAEAYYVSESPKTANFNLVAFDGCNVAQNGNAKRNRCHAQSGRDGVDNTDADKDER